MTKTNRDYDKEAAKKIEEISTSIQIFIFNNFSDVSSITTAVALSIASIRIAFNSLSSEEEFEDYKLGIQHLFKIAESQFDENGEKI